MPSDDLPQPVAYAESYNSTVVDARIEATGWHTAPLFSLEQITAEREARIKAEEERANDAADPSRGLWRFWAEKAAALAKRVDATEARLRDAEAVIAPFAKEAEYWRDIPSVSVIHDNVELWQNPGHRTRMNVGNLRAAAAFLASKDGNHGS